MSVGWGMGVKDPHKECSFKFPSPEPICAMLSRAPSWLLAEAKFSVSSVTGCNSGSMQTLWQTFVRRVAVRSLIPL